MRCPAHMAGAAWWGKARRTATADCSMEGRPWRGGGEGFSGYDQGSSEAHAKQAARRPHSLPSSPLDEHIPDNLAVDGARDTVLQLQVHLGNRVVTAEDRGLEDVACCS